MKKLILLSSFVFLASSTANAGIYLEPYVGYVFNGKAEGSVEVNGFGTVAVDQTSKGVAFGGKVGYSFMGLAVGADYSQFKASNTDETGQDEAGDSTAKDLGGFVQYTFPVMLKVSATYIFSSDSSDDDSEWKGSGYKVGVGYTGLPFVAINLDYVALKYDDISADGLIIDSGDLDVTAMMLSVSLPLDF